MAIAANVEEVRGRIARACEGVFRDPEEVTLVAVTKTVDVDAVAEAIAAGVTAIGENRVQEAAKKFADDLPPVEKHLVGHLQRNKVRKALEIFDIIESVDSVRLAREISTVCAASGREMDVLVEVNTSGEESKYGLEPEEAVEAVAEMADLPGLRIRGLMTVGAFLPDPEDVRPCFRALRAVRDGIEERVIPGVTMDQLSMGMTNDFEVAIEEGATIVRVGRAIFGERAA